MDEFSQIHEKLIDSMQWHLKLEDELDFGLPSAHECMTMFANFFLCIAKRPDWMEDWPVY